MNKALFKQGIKSNWKILLIFVAVISMYVTIMIYMFDPAMMQVLEAFFKSMPQMMAFFGMNTAYSSLGGFLASYLYGFILLIFPMVYIIMTANNFIVSHIDKGSMAYLLASPNKRSSIAFTRAFTLILGIFILVAYATGLSISVSEALFPGELDIKGYLALNLGLFCVQFFIGSLCFLSSCITNDVKKASFIGGGISVLCFLFQSLANVGEKFEFLKYTSFFTLFDTQKLLALESNGFIMIACLFAAGALLFATGIISFSRRDLHI